MFNTNSWSLMFNTFYFVDIRSAQSMKHLFLFHPEHIGPLRLRRSSQTSSAFKLTTSDGFFHLPFFKLRLRRSSQTSSGFQVDFHRNVGLKIQKKNFHISAAGDGKFFILFRVDYSWSSSEFVITS